MPAAVGGARADAVPVDVGALLGTRVAACDEDPPFAILIPCLLEAAGRQLNLLQSAPDFRFLGKNSSSMYSCSGEMMLMVCIKQNGLQCEMGGASRILKKDVHLSLSWVTNWGFRCLPRNKLEFCCILSWQRKACYFEKSTKNCETSPSRSWPWLFRPEALTPCITGLLGMDLRSPADSVQHIGCCTLAQLHCVQHIPRWETSLNVANAVDE